MIEKIHMRVIGYCAAAVIHLYNCWLVFIALTSPMGPELEKIFFMKWRYITIWNLFFQGGYAAIGLLCDLPILLKWEEKHEILNFLRWLRSILFSSIVFPTTFYIFVIFWPVFLYDRELIFPAVIDTILSPVSNQIMHSIILPIVLWEFIFMEKRLPKPDAWCRVVVTSLVVIYNMVMFHTYFVYGMWPYPMIEKVLGTIFFFLIFLYFFTVSAISFYIQFYIADLFNLNDKLSAQKVK